MAASAADFENKAKEVKNRVDQFNPEHKEGPVAKTIEQQTSKVPSDVYLWTAIGCMAVSLTLKVMGKDKEVLFVGQWPAPFLIMGLYNKIVKLEGSD
jgi:hypothetical protein